MLDGVRLRLTVRRRGRSLDCGAVRVGGREKVMNWRTGLCLAEMMMVSIEFRIMMNIWAISYDETITYARFRRARASRARESDDEKLSIR